jgi:hypothetical protein
MINDFFRCGFVAGFPEAQALVDIQRLFHLLPTLAITGVAQ